MTNSNDLYIASGDGSIRFANALQQHFFIANEVISANKLLKLAQIAGLA